jgi:prepilin-type N-terminal cleavage/methylation domain-containing protein
MASASPSTGSPAVWPPVTRDGVATARGEAGFTLLEVLVALTILSTVLVVLLPLFADAPRRREAIEAHRFAISLARSKLEAIGREIPAADGVADGQFDNGFGWHVEIVPYAAPVPVPDFLALKSVTLTVRWPRWDSTQNFTVRTLRLVAVEGRP